MSHAHARVHAGAPSWAELVAWRFGAVAGRAARRCPRRREAGTEWASAAGRAGGRGVPGEGTCGGGARALAFRPLRQRRTHRVSAERRQKCLQSPFQAPFKLNQHLCRRSLGRCLVGDHPGGSAVQPGVRRPGGGVTAVTVRSGQRALPKRTPHGAPPSSAWTEGSACSTRGQVATSRGAVHIRAGISARFSSLRRARRT